MVTFKNRLASNQDLALVFSICAFPIYVWSIFNVLKEVPAWLLRLSAWDLIGIIAYTQLFALLESVLVFVALIILGGVLPARLFRDKFVPQSSMAVLLTSSWVMLAHSYSGIFNPDRVKQLALWFALYLISLGLAYAAVQRYQKLQALLRAFGNRLMVLSSVYIAIGVLSAAVVVLRNV